MNEQGQRDILITFAKLFAQFKVPYLLTGSLACSSYGYPRATHDIDFVLEIEEKAKKQLVNAVSSLPHTYLQDKVELHNVGLTFYTLYHTETATKVDLWLVSDQEFAAKWKRRRSLHMGNLAIPIISPEDLILTKLSWCKQVASERHMRDCVGMWKVQNGKLDAQYLFARAKEFDVNLLLQQVIAAKEY